MRVISNEPHPSVEKQLACRGCGATLAYVPNDVKDKRVSCMGDVDTVYYIECPSCRHETSVRSA